MNRNNVSFSDDDISFLKTSNGYIDFSLANKPNSKPETITDNVERKRKLSSIQQNRLTEYKIDSDLSNDEKLKLELEMIRSRWNVTCLADPNVNLTVSNYRKRLFGDNRAPTRREFIPDVTLEKTFEYDDKDDRKETQDELLKRDKQSLNERISSINEKYDRAKIKVKSDFQAQYRNNFK